MQETQVQSLGWEDPLEKEMEPTPVFLPGKSHGQRSLAGYSSWNQRRVGHDWANTHTCTHSVLQLKANFSVLLKQYNSKYFTQSPVYYKDFPPRLLRTKIIIHECFVISWNCFSCPLQALSPDMVVSSHPSGEQNQADDLRIKLWRSQKSSLSAALLSPIFCPTNSNLLTSLNSHLHLFSPVRITGLCLGPLSCKILRQEIETIIGLASFFSFT